MSAMVTTAPLESAADENGVTMSPTLALFDRITPSNGARITRVVDGDLRVARVRLGHADRRLRVGDARDRAIGAPLRGIDRRLRHEALGAADPRCASADVGASRSSACACSSAARRRAARWPARSRACATTSRLSMPRDDLAALHARAFGDAEPFEPAGRLRRDRRLALRDDIAGRVQHDELLRRDRR